MTKKLLSFILSALLLLSALPLVPLAARVEADTVAYSADAEVADLPILEVDRVINNFDNVPTTGTATVGDYTVNIGIGANTDDPKTTDYSANSSNSATVVTIEDGALKSTLSSAGKFYFSVALSPVSLTRGNASPTADTVALQLHIDLTGITSVEAGTAVRFEPEIYLSSGRSSGYTAYCIPGETFYYIPDATAENPNPETEILTTGGGVLVEHGSVFGYAGQSGTVIIPFDAWDTEARAQFSGACTIWNFYTKNTQSYHNRSSVSFETYDKSYAAGDAFLVDDICWMKKPSVSYDLQKTVEDFKEFTPAFAWGYADGNHSAYSNSPDGAVTKDDISVTDGRLAVTPNSTAVDDTRFTVAVESELWKSEYEAFAFDVDLSETTGNKSLRFKFYGYTADGNTEFGVYNTTITLIADDGTISTLTLGESSNANSTWDVPDSFKGKIIIPKSSVHAQSGDIADTFDEVMFSLDVLGWKAADNGKSVYIDNMAYYYNGAKLPTDAGTDFTTLSSQQYEASALIKDAVHTAEAYFKTDSNLTQSIIATKFGNVDRHGYLVNMRITALGQLELTLGSATVTVTNAALNDGEWHHAAVVASDDGASVSCYVDGAKAKTVAIDSFTVPELAYYLPVTVGSFMPAESKYYKVFDGSIANVRLWSDARTAEELATNAAVSVGADAEGLIAEWTLEGEDFTADTTGKYDLKEFFWNIDTENALFAQYNRDAAEGEFTIIFLPDTQTIIKNFEAQVPDIFDWIIANAERLNIKAVVSLGDIVENGNKEGTTTALEREMIILSAQYSRLTAAGIPWVATPGDHDYDYFGDRTSTIYDKYFREDMLVNTDEFELGGLYDENSLLNSYYYMRPNAEVEYILFSLEVQPRDEVITWASSVIAANPDCRVIIATHKYMNYAYCKRHTTVAYNHGNHGETLWQELVSKHKNIDMILCGHNETTGIYTAYDTGSNGNKVLQVNCDMQNTDQSYKTVGATVIARFGADGSKVSFNLYSAHHNLFIDNHSNDISFDLGNAEDELGKPLADEYFGGADFSIISSKDANSFPAESGGYINSATDTGASVNPEYYGWIGSGNASYSWDEATEAGKYTATADCDDSANICAIVKALPNADSNMLSFHLDATDVSTVDGNFTALLALTYNKAGHTVKGNSDIYFVADGSDTVETIHIAKSSATWNHRIQLKAGVSGTYYIPASCFDPTTNEENGYDEAYGTNWTYLSDLATSGKTWWFNSQSSNYKYCYLYFYQTTLCNGDTFYVDDITFHNVVSYLDKLTDVTAVGFSGTFDGQPHGISVTAPEGATVKYGTVRGEYELNASPTFTEVGTYSVYYQIEKDGYKPYKGTEAVEITGLPVAEESKSLTLTDSITVDYKLDGSVLEDYSDVRAEFEINGTVTEVTNYTVKDGKYVFSFSGVNPKNVGDTITATYYMTKDGIEYPSVKTTYSVAEYCYNIINNYADTNADYTEVLAVCKGLLNFAAASQEYFGYNADSLVNADLADEDKDLTVDALTNAMKITANEGVSTVKWRSAGLNFSSNVALRFNIEAESIEGLRVKATVNGTDWWIPAEAFVKIDGAENRYYVYFNKLSVACMRDVVEFTVYDEGGTQVSDTLTYSIESYAAAKYQGTDAIANLCKAMMNYGDAANALKNAITNN